jgi:ATP sulfurylase
MNTTVDSLIAPHGGALVNREIKVEARRDAIAAAARLPRVALNAVQYSDVCCIATGVFSPLTGFVGRADYESILDRMRLTNGTVWSIPITLAVANDVAAAIRRAIGRARGSFGPVVATLDVTERYTYDKRREADAVYRTTKPFILVWRDCRSGDVLLAGPITLLERPG